MPVNYSSLTAKTLKRVTLTSGTSYTVPANVTNINVCCIGGGAGGSSAGTASGFNNYVPGLRGGPGQSIWSTIATTGGATIAYAIGAGGAAASTGGTTTFTGATSATGGVASSGGGTAAFAQVASVGFSNGGMAGFQGGAYLAVQTGGTGGSGSVIVEYWS